MLASAVYKIFYDIILRLHIRLLQIDHDQIRFFAGCQTVAIVQPHRMRTTCRGHIQDFIRTDTLCIHFTHLRQCTCQKHFLKHIQAVVARRSVCTDRHRNTFLHKSFQRCDTACQLQVGCRAGNCGQLTFLKDLKIFIIKIYTMVSTAAILIHAKFFRQLRRRLAITLQTLLHLILSLGIVQEYR